MIRDNLVKVCADRALVLVSVLCLQLGKDSESKLLYTDVPRALTDAFAKTDAELGRVCGASESCFGALTVRIGDRTLNVDTPVQPVSLCS